MFEWGLIRRTSSLWFFHRDFGRVRNRLRGVPSVDHAEFLQFLGSSCELKVLVECLDRRCFDFVVRIARERRCPLHKVVLGVVLNVFDEVVDLSAFVHDSRVCFVAYDIFKDL